MKDFDFNTSGSTDTLLNTEVSPIELTEEQQRAFNEIIDFINDDTKQYFSLKGYAGTGKTTIITKLANDIKKVGARVYGKYIPHVIVSAPTNKAVKVLRTKLEESGTTTPSATIHKLLAVRPFINKKTGEEEYKPDNYAEKDILDYNMVIVDEASMVNHNLMEIIKEELEHFAIKILFVGDPAQLPPVNEYLSPSFEVEGDTELNKVVRYGDVINKFATFIRKNQNKHIKIPYISEYDKQNDHGIETVIKKDFLKLVNETFTSEKYQKNSDYCRILSYTNDKVDFWNRHVRSLLLGDDLPEFVVSDRLVAKDACLNENGDYIILKNSEEVIVNSTEFKTYKGLKYWELTCKVSDTLDDVKLRPIHESSKKELEKKLSMYAGKKEWKKFWDLKKYFHDLTYCHALTCHKSQGSSFNKVFIDVSDIYKNQKVKERNQLLYVAVTRATNNVYLKKN